MSSRHRALSWAILLVILVMTATPMSLLADSHSRLVQDEITHRVRPGETLATIAARYGTTVSALVAYNGLRNPNVIYVGQPLRIPAAKSSPSEQGARTHVVQRGEYLALIARRYGTTIWAIMRENDLTHPNTIYVGQRLRIPGPPSTTPTASPAPNPTVTPTATPTPTAAVTTVASPTEAPHTETVQSQPTPTPTATVHVVKRGEFLASIAQQYGVTVQDILAHNRLRNPNILYTGQKLVIPASGPRPSPPQTKASASPSQSTSAAARAVNPPTTGKWIDVNVTTQTLSAYEGDKLVFTTKVSTGLPRTPTVLGTFRIRTKLRAQTMAGPGYYLPNVPYVMYFYGGYAIHGTYWHNNFGRPMSHGCVNMRTSEAKWLYDWAPIGTIVVTHR